MTLDKKTIELTVCRVGHGGNTGEGQYFYSFTSQNILVDTPDTIIEFVLGKDTSDGIEIWKVVTSSPDQFRDVVRDRTGQSLSMVNANTMEELISVSVLVIDNAADGRIVNCDPQMINVPR
jgi:hypothetical protein